MAAHQTKPDDEMLDEVGQPMVEGNEEVVGTDPALSVKNLFVIRKRPAPRIPNVVDKNTTNAWRQKRSYFQDVDFENNPVVQQFVQETGCPVFMTDKVDVNDAILFLLEPHRVDIEKVCTRIPPTCPDVGYWVFLIALDHVDPDDFSFDDLGKWNRPSGRRFYVEKEGEILKKVGKSKEPEANWDYVIRCNWYTHPGTEQRFSKWTYMAFNNNNELLGPYGLIIYFAEVPPQTLRRMPHLNAKSSDKPMVRTKRSTLKQAKSMLATHTPKEVVETMKAAQAVTGNDIPRDIQQIANIAFKTPGAVRAPRGRPRGTGGLRTRGGLIRRPRMCPNRSRSPIDDVHDDDLPLPNQPSTSRPLWSSGMLPNLQIEVLQAEKKKHETETEKLELEMTVLRAQKYKLDMEINRMRAEDGGDMVIVQDGDGEYNQYNMND